MRKLSLMLALAAGCLLVAGVCAEEKKEVALKGTLLCAKCVLKETKKCQTAIQVKEAGKTVTYYLVDKGSKEEYHEAVCGGGEEGRDRDRNGRREGRQEVHCAQEG